MIPTGHPYQADYSREHNGRRHYMHKPVIGWDDEGFALVADEKTGQLRRANSWTNFAGLSEPESPVVAAVPGGGWRAEFKQDDGTTDTCPVVAWAIRGDGTCFPLDVDSTGISDDPTTVGNFECLVPPEETP